jgi:hypothetical protein
MQDVGNKVGAYKIKIQRYFREFESHMMRVYPDNDHLTDIICKFAQLPEDYRIKKGEQMRAKAQPYYNWDRVAKIWEDAIDKISPSKKNWTDPPALYESYMNKPYESSESTEFVKSVFTDVYRSPEHVYSLHGLNLLRDINLGATVTSNGVEHLDKKKVVERLANKNDGRNVAEQARCGLIKLQDEEFIKFANNRLVKTGK